MTRQHARLTHAAFRQWLEGFPPDHELGFIQSCFGCPLAIYLNATRQEDGCWVGERTWYDGENRRHVLPRWAQRFVARLDTELGASFTVEVEAVRRVLEETR